MPAERDYRKFLNATGELHVRLLPRAVYTSLVKEFRQAPEAIQTVFETFFLTWDLNREIDAQAARGEERDIASAAQAVLDGLDDADWWRVNEAFERALIQSFEARAGDWTELLDPVYDEQEARGWRNYQA